MTLLKPLAYLAELAMEHGHTHKLRKKVMGEFVLRPLRDEE